MSLRWGAYAVGATALAGHDDPGEGNTTTKDKRPGRRQRIEIGNGRSNGKNDTNFFFSRMRELRM